MEQSDRFTSLVVYFMEETGIQCDPGSYLQQFDDVLYWILARKRRSRGTCFPGDRMVVFYPMLFLSGASIPLEVMPESIQKFENFLPHTYVVWLLRGLWFGESWSDHFGEIVILLGVLVVCTAVAARFFRWE